MSTNVPSPAATPDGGPPPGERGDRELPFLVRFLIFAPLLVLLAAVAGIGALFIYYSVVFPDPLSMRPRTSGPVIRILALDGAVLDERGAARDYMPLDLLPRRVTDAVVATEDRRFFEHPGLDPVGLTRALIANVRAGRFAQGGSTLTQQLAKNLFLSSDRTLVRKLEEFVLALWLELKLSKRDILELYLNRVYFGGGAHGIEAAAQRYFGKSARDLSLAEAAVIAGLLKAPSKYAPSASPVQALARGRVVLARMQAAGFISEQEESAAQSEQVRFSGMSRLVEKSGTAYAVDHVMEELPPVQGAEEADIVVDTTLDARLQRRASEIVSRELAQQGQSLAASQGAAVVLAPDGGIRALVGGRSYSDSQFNRAIKAQRQPGSAFKPIVYLTALEAGSTPDRVLLDQPLSVAGWSPRNEGGRYVGAVTMRDALAHSINSVAVRLLLEVGAPRVIATARRLGITSQLRRDASLALGTSEVSLLELTSAYAAFANGGYVQEPYVIRRVRTSTGRTLYTRPVANTKPQVPAQHVAAMNDMLRATLVSGTGRRAALSNQLAAGKTGTSQEFRDAWFVGYTAHLTAGIWVGNDSGDAMNKVMGGGLPADIWRQVMTVAHDGLLPAPLPDASGPARPPVARAGAGDAIAARRADPIARLVKATENAAAPRLTARQGHYPRQGSGEDFISRALDGGTLAPRDFETTEPGAGESQSIIVRPPAGSMSLGRGVD
jgi:penicillin-binding protein 1A